jgi:hypothetical protein
MKRVIIESPYAGNVARNKLYLQYCIRDCLRRGESPYASHQMLTEALDDNDPEQRKLGMEAGFAWSEVVAMHVFYLDLGWSPGMKVARGHRSQRVDERPLPMADFRRFVAECDSRGFL